MFAASVAVLLYVRKGLVQYTTQLLYSLDAILAGEEGIDLQEDREMLSGKLQAKLSRFNEVMEQRAGRISGSGSCLRRSSPTYPTR